MTPGDPVYTMVRMMFMAAKSRSELTDICQRHDPAIRGLPYHEQLRLSELLLRRADALKGVSSVEAFAEFQTGTADGAVPFRPGDGGKVVRLDAARHARHPPPRLSGTGRLPRAD